MTDENAKKAEELLNQASEQKRHQTEPSESEPDVDLQTAIEGVYAAIDAGEKPENVTVRDKNLVALLDGLEAAGELTNVIESARGELGRDGDLVSRSEAARLLVRVGLNEIAPDVVETAAEARKEHEVSDIQF